MNTLTKWLLLTLVTLCGCAHHYVVTLNNGTQVTASTKPRLEKGYYFFKDSQGRDSYVAAGRVREIESGGTVKETNYKVPPVK